MKRLLLTVLAVLVMATGASSQEQPGAATRPAAAGGDAAVETIVCIRHAEKPVGGLGQLTVKGLNRSLALPRVLMGKYGKPQYIFAPDPAKQVQDMDGQFFYYIRPLATIEPTAIVCGLPVNTGFGYRDINQLQNELAKPKYRQSVVFVAWEYFELANFAKNVVREYKGDLRLVPAWPADDFDTIYVFTIKTQGARKTFTFSVDHEGLNDVSDKYPEPAGR